MSPLLAEWIEQVSGFSVDIDNPGTPVSGGCINECKIYQSDRDPIFIKFNRAEHIDLFEAEIKGLKLLEATNTIRVPESYGCGVVEHQAVLLLEAIELENQQSDQHQSEMARKLAALHNHTSPDGAYGLSFNNHIGKTPQPNTAHPNWAEFFISNRLEYQFGLAARNGWNFSQRKKLYHAITPLLSQDYNPKPSLVHGDLWSGNAAFDESGQPVIFDPAVYYGDPETDIAFTQMFGGFSPAFYTTYREINPAAPKTEARHKIYNLYHLLNHYNLFGGSYRQQAEQVIAELVS